MTLFKFYKKQAESSQQDFWQKPKKKVCGNDQTWYENGVLRHDSLNDIMKTISKKSELPQIYTNHSIRATCLTKFDECGFKACPIQAISGHKSEASI